MSRPLPPGDPVRLGPYRLSARLSETSAGIVYLGVDDSGRRASVAVLNRGAAGDAAARDRFRAAINAELPGVGRFPDPAPGEPAPVVAAQPEGPAPWVATSYDADQAERAGAERFLDSVTMAGSFRGRRPGRRRGPQFQPYWLGAGEPALEGPPEPPRYAPPVPERSERGLVAALLTLAGILVLLALLMLLLFACQPKVSEPPPPPPDPPSQPVPPPPAPSPSETSRSPSPRPSSPTPPGTPTPGPSDGEGGDDGGAL
ncbi:hypothetical protein GCM10023085_44060 [Actinomadura viridis]|uniref:Serine/threonine protein kinase n=1 Tax=Actinomadura viridis TaxID=58110 RepID=A0A931DNB3_9ACTN|nr:hypothetical protein [Actinomadura viridis]MBG6089768.1 hypothetical protein [Actinomadura viridis]